MLKAIRAGTYREPDRQTDTHIDGQKDRHIMRNVRTPMD